jgi:hypothetical protein
MLANSSGMYYKLDHTRYSNALVFNSSAFQVMSSVVVKWFAYLVYTLYSNKERRLPENQ